jgi:hypothetical protein
MMNLQLGAVAFAPVRVLDELVEIRLAVAMKKRTLGSP